jgi:integrase
MKTKNSRNKLGRRPVAANFNPQAVGPVLTPEAAASLLKNCGDPLATLQLALQLFAGLHPAEVESLKWRAFEYQGYVDAFRVQYRPGIPIHCLRSVRILGVLEAWLEPFTLRTDTVCFDERARTHAAEALRTAGINDAATLRHTYITYVLPQIAELSDWAAFCSIEREDIQDRLIPSISAEDTELMSSLTPKKVGIRNWPKRVARALKQIANTTGTSHCG